MIHHKKLVFIIGLGFVLMSVIALWLARGSESQFDNDSAAASKALQAAQQNKPMLGKPCDVRGDANAETNGLQCYFYGDSDNRQGIWIKPDLRMPNLSTTWALKPLAWKDFSDSKVGVTLPVPDGLTTSSPSTDPNMPELWVNEDDGRILDVRRVQKNSVTSRQVLDQDKQDGSASSTDRVTLNSGVEATRLLVYPKDNLTQAHEIWVIDQDSYYLYLRADIPDDPALRYIVEYMVANLKINQPTQ